MRNVAFAFIIFVCSSLLISQSDGTTFSKSLGKAVCTQTSEFASSNQVQPALKRKGNYPNGASGCLRRDGAGDTFVPHNKCPSESSGAGGAAADDDDSGPVGVSVRRMGIKTRSGEPTQYVVRIIYRAQTDSENFIQCIGTLYNKRWIVTTYNCAHHAVRRHNNDDPSSHDPGIVQFSGPASDWWVWCEDPKWPEEYTIVEGKVPEYDESLVDADVYEARAQLALVKVDRDVEGGRAAFAGIYEQTQPASPSTFHSLNTAISKAAEITEKFHRSRFPHFYYSVWKWDIETGYDRVPCKFPDGVEADRRFIGCGVPVVSEGAGPTCAEDLGAPIIYDGKIYAVLDIPTCHNEFIQTPVFTLAQPYKNWIEKVAGPQG